MFFVQVPNLVFLAVSPEEKESWINTLNVAIIRAKNRVFDEVRVRSFSSQTELLHSCLEVRDERRL